MKTIRNSNVRLMASTEKSSLLLVGGCAACLLMSLLAVHCMVEVFHLHHRSLLLQRELNLINDQILVNENELKDLAQIAFYSHGVIENTTTENEKDSMRPESNRRFLRSVQRRKSRKRVPKKRMMSRHGKPIYSTGTSPSAIHLMAPLSLQDWKNKSMEQNQKTEPIRGGKLSRNGLTPSGDKYTFWEANAGRLYPGKAKFASYDKVSGKLHIGEPGLYYIYSQIVYHGFYNRYSYGIHVNDKLALQCLSVEGKEDIRDEEIYRTCSVSGTLKLGKLDTIYIKNKYQGVSRTIHPLNSLSFWGMVQL